MTIKEANELTLKVCKVLAIDFEHLISKSRKADLILQRRAFIKLLSDTGMTSKNVGKVFNQSHSNVICSNKKHKDFLDIKDKIYISVFERIKKEFIFRIHSVDNTIQSLLDIITAENVLRHDELIESSRKNKKLKKEIEYLKDQINVLNK